MSFTLHYIKLYDIYNLILLTNIIIIFRLVSNNKLISLPDELASIDV